MHSLLFLALFIGLAASLDLTYYPTPIGAAGAPETEDWIVSFPHSLASTTVMRLAGEPLMTTSETVECYLRSSTLGSRRALLLASCQHGNISSATTRKHNAFSSVRRWINDRTVYFRLEANKIVSVNGTQHSAPPALDRIDSRTWAYDTTFHYLYTGTGIKIYSIDTGVRITHQEFGGRATFGFNAMDDGIDSDCNGHGTHTAALAAGVTYGVAKTASVISIKVLSCAGYGTSYTVAAGLLYAEEDCTAQPGAGFVAVLSLGGGISSVLDDALNSLITACPIVAAVAAGNSGSTSCTSSPASVVRALTVAASTFSDTLADYSNYGSPCVDLAAPGDYVISAYHTSNSATAVMSGTSQATPLVAGVGATVMEQLVAGAELLPGAPTFANLGEYATWFIKYSATPNKIARPGLPMLSLLYSHLDVTVAPPPSYSAPPNDPPAPPLSVPGASDATTVEFMSLPLLLTLFLL
jgi:subtilisin family serine protease